MGGGPSVGYSSGMDNFFRGVGNVFGGIGDRVKVKDGTFEGFEGEVSAIDPQRDNEVIVRFKITEHSQVSVKRVTFIGNDSIPEEELRSVMFTGQGGILSFGSGGPFRQDAFERDVAQDAINTLVLTVAAPERAPGSARRSGPRSPDATTCSTPSAASNAAVGGSPAKSISTCLRSGGRSAIGRSST